MWSICSKTFFATACTLGEKLRKLLVKHGNFKKVEIAVRRYYERKSRYEKKAGWYTRNVLMEKHSWTKSLCPLYIGSSICGMFRVCVSPSPLNEQHT